MATTPFSPMELWQGRVGSEVYAVHNGKQVIRNYTPGKGNIEAIRRWQRKNLLALVNLDDKPIVVSITKMTEQAPTLALHYSRNGVKWHLWGFTSTEPLNINIDPNSRVFIRGVGNIATCLPTDENEIIDDHNQFSATGLYGFEGSLLKILDAKWSDSKPLQSHAFAGLFKNDTNIVTAPELPSINISRDCYRYMFAGTSSLQTPPQLPALTMKPFCYSYMFYKSGIETTPELPALILSSSCYRAMFQESYIKNMPVLNAETLEVNCYENMFRNCVSLIKGSEMNAKKLEYHACYQMFFNCYNLIESPILSCKQGFSNSYAAMFQDCIKLSKITCLLESEIQTTATNWVPSQLAQEGIFIMSQTAYDENMWPDGVSGVPVNWTKQPYQP